ncbi:MAG: hypothetical protein ACT4QG_01875 [Sporichthyaceae bacterium]
MRPVRFGVAAGLATGASGILLASGLFGVASSAPQPDVAPSLESSVETFGDDAGGSGYDGFGDGYGYGYGEYGNPAEYCEYYCR